MREFNSFEKTILERITSINTEFKLEEISLARIMREEIGAFAITWNHIDNDGRKFLRIWNNPPDNRLLLKLIEFIVLIKELESLGFILLNSGQGRSTNALYDRSKYTYDGECFIDNTDSHNKIFYGKEAGCMGGFNHYSLMDELDYYSGRYIYPTGKLIDFVKKCFRTEEQIQFEAQIAEATKQTKNSRRALYVSWGALLASLVGLGFSIFTSLPARKLDGEQSKNPIYSIESIAPTNPVGAKSTIITQ